MSFANGTPGGFSISKEAQQHTSAPAVGHASQQQQQQARQSAPRSMVPAKRGFDSISASIGSEGLASKRISERDLPLAGSVSSAQHENAKENERDPAMQNDGQTSRDTSAFLRCVHL